MHLEKSRGEDEASQIISAIMVIIIGVGGCVAYFWGANKLVDLIFPAHGVKGQAAAATICAPRARSGRGCSSARRCSS
jgi:hypothetical protein